MGLRITKTGDSGQTPLDIVYGLLNELGNQDECDKIAVVSQILGKKVERMTDLTTAELSKTAVEILKFKNV
jgi:hypothetical protein